MILVTVLLFILVGAFFGAIVGSRVWVQRDGGVAGMLLGAVIGAGLGLFAASMVFYG